MVGSLLDEDAFDAASPLEPAAEAACDAVLLLPQPVSIVLTSKAAVRITEIALFILFPPNKKLWKSQFTGWTGH